MATVGVKRLKLTEGAYILNWRTVGSRLLAVE